MFLPQVIEPIIIPETKFAELAVCIAELSEICMVCVHTELRFSLYFLFFCIGDS